MPDATRKKIPFSVSCPHYPQMYQLRLCTHTHTALSEFSKKWLLLICPDAHIFLQMNYIHTNQQRQSAQMWSMWLLPRLTATNSTEKASNEYFNAESFFLSGLPRQIKGAHQKPFKHHLPTLMEAQNHSIFLLKWISSTYLPSLSKYIYNNNTVTQASNLCKDSIILKLLNC